MPARAGQAESPSSVGIAVELFIAYDAVDSFHPGIGPLALTDAQTALAGRAPAVRVARVAPPVVVVQRESAVAEAASFRHG